MISTWDNILKEGESRWGGAKEDEHITKERYISVKQEQDNLVVTFYWHNGFNCAVKELRFSNTQDNEAIKLLTGLWFKEKDNE